MSADTVLLAAASVIAALLGLIGVLLGMIHKNAKGASKKADVLVGQVRNSHSTNLRDDLDEKFQGLSTQLGEVSKDMGGMKEDIRLIRRDQTADRAAAAEGAHLAGEAMQLARQALASTDPKHPTQGES